MGFSLSYCYISLNWIDHCHRSLASIERILNKIIIMMPLSIQIVVYYKLIHFKHMYTFLVITYQIYHIAKVSVSRSHTVMNVGLVWFLSPTDDRFLGGLYFYSCVSSYHHVAVFVVA